MITAEKRAQVCATLLEAMKRQEHHFNEAGAETTPAMRVLMGSQFLLGAAVLAMQLGEIELFREITLAGLDGTMKGLALIDKDKP